ncbi:MAG: LacI family DNA-binding transcriptional regulator [Verrucomicrobiota bacterium]
MSLEDIAKAAGVSRMTVSRALRNHPEISKRTNQRILEMAAKLGYRPNPLISIWMTKVSEGRRKVSTPVLAFLSGYADIPSRQSMIFRSGFFAAASERADALGFRLEEHAPIYKGISPERMSAILKARGYTGCIFAPFEQISDWSNFEWESFSAVAIGYTLRVPDIHRVVVNHFMGMNSVLETLLRMGKKKIGLVLKTLSDDRTNHLWTSAYLGFLWHHSGVSSLSPFVNSDLNRREFSDWFRLHKPDVIVGADSEILDWIEAVDRRAPAKRCVFVHLHEEFSDDPRTMGVVTSASKEVGKAAVDILVGQLKLNERGIPASPRVSLVPCEFKLCNRR